jgi:hypothetical protein
VPIQAVYSRGPYSYIFVGRNQGSAEPVRVTTGASSDQYIDIREGIKEDDVVLLAISENMIAKVPTQSEENGDEPTSRSVTAVEPSELAADAPLKATAPVQQRRSQSEARPDGAAKPDGESKPAGGSRPRRSGGKSRG